jgi:hypothetical protein
MTTKVDKIEIDSELLNKISKIAKNKNTTETKLINDILKKEVEKPVNKIPDYLIANKDTYDPDYKGMEKNAGFVKNVAPFDAVKLIRDVREGKG